MRRFELFVTAALLICTASPRAAQNLSGSALVTELQRGGNVLVMRHTSSPSAPPNERTANADNVGRERQLDAKGRDTAIAMGQALRTLHIPIGEVLSSPTYRALETAHAMMLPRIQPVAELGDRGVSMQGVTPDQIAWLRDRVAQLPRGTNTLVITHQPNMSAAFPQWTNGLADGETLVFGPDGSGAATMVARVKIEEWPRLKA